MIHKPNLLTLFFAFLICMLLSACTSIPAYQRIYLNDSDMQFVQDGLENYEMNAMNYREGASGGGKGKTGGGCGCN